MKRKVILSITFLISLLPMLMIQYGGMQGSSGNIRYSKFIQSNRNIVCYSIIVRVWIPLNNKNINKFLGSIGVIGIVVSEIYKFFTWHILSITGKISLNNSLRLVYPEFYIGLVVSLAMVVVYFEIHKLVKE